jgi:hypothetical protein
VRSRLPLILGRLVAILAGILLFGIFLRLLLLVFSAILPAGLMQVLTAGWNSLWFIVGPAVGPLAGLVILGAIVMVFISRR